MTPDQLGQGQSPIDISDWVRSDATAPVLAYASAAARVERSQGFVMIHFAGGSELQVGNESYRLLQLHWHTPAEHTVDGEEFDAEVHFVHSNEREELLVVGVVHRLGDPDDGLQRIIDELPAEGEEAGVVPALSSAELAPRADAFYHYVGSLTAAPFSEPVQWYVLQSPGTVSQRQVEQLQELTGGPNARPLQDRNGRTIRCVGCSS